MPAFFIRACVATLLLTPVICVIGQHDDNFSNLSNALLGDQSSSDTSSQDEQRPQASQPTQGEKFMNFFRQKASAPTLRQMIGLQSPQNRYERLSEDRPPSSHQAVRIQSERQFLPKRSADAHEIQAHQTDVNENDRAREAVGSRTAAAQKYRKIRQGKSMIEDRLPDEGRIGPSRRAPPPPPPDPRLLMSDPRIRKMVKEEIKNTRREEKNLYLPRHHYGFDATNKFRYQHYKPDFLEKKIMRLIPHLLVHKAGFVQLNLPYFFSNARDLKRRKLAMIHWPPNQASHRITGLQIRLVLHAVGVRWLRQQGSLGPEGIKQLQDALDKHGEDEEALRREFNERDPARRETNYLRGSVEAARAQDQAVRFKQLQERVEAQKARNRAAFDAVPRKMRRPLTLPIPGQEGKTMKPRPMQQSGGQQ